MRRGNARDGKIMTVVALLTYTSDDEDLKKGSKIQKLTEAVSSGPESPLDVMGGRKKELRMTFIFLAWITSWMLLMEIQERASMMVRLFIFFGEKEKKHSILIILRSEVLVGHLGGAILHVVAKGGKVGTRFQD